MISRVLSSVPLLLHVVTSVWAAQIPLATPEDTPHSTTYAQQHAITPELASFVSNLLETYNVHGISVGVVHITNGEIKEELGTWGNKTEVGDPVTHQTLFNIGSCSKAFTSSAVGILMDDFAKGTNVTALPPNVKRFTWRTKIHDLFPGDPEWKLMDQWASEKANVGDILSHISGLPRHEPSYGPKESPKEIVENMRYLKPSHELREKWSYNNQMYMLGAYIVTKYSGKPFHEFVKERIFGPLGMSSSTYVYKEVADSGHFSQTFDNGRRIPFWFADESMTELVSGAGGVISNGVDMTKWLATLLNEGVNPYTNETVIPRSVFEETTKARSIVTGKATSLDLSIVGYGMGWGRSSYKGHEIVTHGGSILGFLTYVAFFPSDGLGIVVTINEGKAFLIPPLVGTHIANHMLGFDDAAEELTGHQELSSLRIALDTYGLPRIPAEYILESQPTISFSNQSLLSFGQYPGKYHDPGYGSFEICSIHHLTSECRTTFLEFLSIYSVHELSGMLFGTWPTFWTRHIALIPVAGSSNQFNLGLSTIFYNGYGKDKTPFETSVYGKFIFAVEFVVRDGEVVGMAVPGGFEYPPIEREEGPLEETTNVYFKKL